MTTTTDTIKALRDALTEIQRFTDSPVTHTIAKRVLALTADASDQPPEPTALRLIQDDDAYALGKMLVPDISRHDAIAFANAILFHAARPAPVAATPAPADPRLDNLRMLVQRLARSLSMADPGSTRPAEALDYLERAGLKSSPLRVAAPAAPIAEVTDLRAAVVAEAAQVCRNAANKYEDRGQRSGIGWQVCVWLEREIRALYTQPAAEHAKPAAQTGAAPSETRMDTHSQPLPADSAEHAKSEPVKFLTADEIAFVRLVSERQGCKLNSGEAAPKQSDAAPLWQAPQELEYIEAVGSYKWRVTNKGYALIKLAEGD